jgi:CRISPR-associated exonuclease Cas4
MIMESDLPLVNTSDLNQYLYCPRRLYYLMFYQTQELNFVLADGRSKHVHQSRRGQWYREMYLRSEKLHLHGKIDLLEGKTKLTPVERKHGTSFFDNDEVQLAAYCMLLEDYLGEPVRMGYLYLFGTNERYAITITDWHRNKVLEIVQAIRSMRLDRIPDFADNPKKCEKCSTSAYCLPEETRMLQEESAKMEKGAVSNEQR